MIETEVEGGERPKAKAVTVILGAGFWRMSFKWATGFLLVSTLGVLLLSVNATQLTESGTAHRVLRQTVASLTEIDSLLERNTAQMVSAGGENAQTAASRLAGFPIDIPVSDDEAAQLSTPEFRSLVLDRSADRLYVEGFAAFREGGSQGATDVQLLSPPGAVRYTAGMLTVDNHDIIQAVMLVLAVVAALLTLALVLLGRGYGRLASVGLAVLLASLPLLLLSVALRFVLRLASEQESDYMTAQLYGLGRDVAWLPIRNGIIFTCLGALFLTMGLAFSLLSGKQEPSPR